MLTGLTVDSSSQIGLALGLSWESRLHGYTNPLGQKMSLACSMTPPEYKPNTATCGFQVLPISKSPVCRALIGHSQLVCISK